MKGRSDLLSVESYQSAKLAALDYQATKQIMLKKFKSGGMGTWVGKPVEEELFN